MTTELCLVREANTDRDGWPTAEWLRDLSLHVEAIQYGMDLADPLRYRVGSCAAAIRAGAEARAAFPAGVERAAALDVATNAAEGIITILPTLRYSSARAEEYRRSRGW